MKYPIITLIMFCTVHLWSQRSVDIRLLETTTGPNSGCYKVQLDFSGDDAVLGSQNYRIYYNSAGLKFLESKSQMHLPEEHYSFRIVQHNEGIDAKGVGKLSFEESLGFINATIILNDARSRAFVLTESQEGAPIISVCFEPKGGPDTHQVVLARKQVTAEYGRAFIELSFIDESGAISALPIINYQDIGQ